MFLNKLSSFIQSVENVLKRLSQLPQNFQLKSFSIETSNFYLVELSPRFTSANVTFHLNNFGAGFYSVDLLNSQWKILFDGEATSETFTCPQTKSRWKGSAFESMTTDYIQISNAFFILSMGEKGSRIEQKLISNDQIC